MPEPREQVYLSAAPERPVSAERKTVLLGSAAVLTAAVCCVSNTLLVTGLVVGGLGGVLSLLTGWLAVPFLLIGLLLLGRALWLRRRP
ncbi:hypothetical protein Dxin01_02458 [Deinococcus xinjiangensis]|uniref:Mercuric ion transport protein n=1 Tax=Deinococcus xinjiangensis TaxID=457454 RepID=A0ABP9VBU8_9DEIO